MGPCAWSLPPGLCSWSAAETVAMGPALPIKAAGEGGAGQPSPWPELGRAGWEHLAARVPAPCTGVPRSRLQALAPDPSLRLGQAVIQPLPRGFPLCCFGEGISHGLPATAHAWKTSSSLMTQHSSHRGLTPSWPQGPRAGLGDTSFGGCQSLSPCAWAPTQAGINSLVQSPVSLGLAGLHCWPCAPTPVSPTSVTRTPGSPFPYPG